MRLECVASASLECVVSASLECIWSVLPGVHWECAAWSAFGVRCLECVWSALLWAQSWSTSMVYFNLKTFPDMGNHKKGKNYNWCNDREYAFRTYSLYCQVTRVFQLTLARKLSIFLWWLQQAFWRPNWSIIQNLTLKMTYSFGMVSVWLKIYFLIIAVLVKTTLMHCPLQKLELVDLEVKKAGFHADSCWLAPFNSQTIWTHKIQYSPTTVYW